MWVLAATLLACGGDDSAPAPGPTPPAPPPAPAPDAGAPDAAPPPPVPDTAPARKTWIDRLATEADLMAYSKEVAGERFTKFVVDLQSGAIYYFDVNVYRVHRDFVFAEIFRTAQTKAAVHAYDYNYNVNKPQFLLCYLVHHLAADAWTFAFWEGDLATKEHTERAYARMRETFYLGDQVRFRPDSDYQEKVAATLQGVPVLSNDELYRSAPYRAFRTGTAIGTLRIAPETTAPDDIVILTEPLADITPVAAIISESFTTPLSNTSLRAAAWGIPDVGMRGAAKAFRGLAGVTVRLEATATAVSVRAATADEIAAWKQRKVARPKITLPRADLTATELRPLHQLTSADARAYGVKAATLGQVAHSPSAPFAVPAGVAIPFHWRAAHLTAAGLDARIAALLADPRIAAEPARRRRELAALRQAIVDAPLDPALLDQVEARVAELTAADPSAGVFVRSSTNAEDLPGFPGAGLYDSVPNVKGRDALAAAIRQVWASTFNLRAHEERTLYKLDHAAVHAGALIQLGIEATAAGVLATVHPTDPSEKTTYTINATSGLGLRVAKGTRIPEILLWDYKNNGLRILSRSAEDTMLVFDPAGGTREVPSPTKGKPVLTPTTARALGKAAVHISTLFPKAGPLDIEWLYRGDQLFIVQVRPHVAR